MTLDECFEYLGDRAALYDGTVADMLKLTPMELWDSPTELYTFWKGKHLSHIYPQDTHPHLRTDWTNIIAEDPSDNMSRGAEVITDSELTGIALDNTADALLIDADITDDSEEVLEVVMDILVDAA